MTNDATKRERDAMVDAIARRARVSSVVLDAMRRVPRHELVPDYNRHLAYFDRPVSVGSGATISQPYIVAYMTDAAAVSRGDRLLEVGTGSGYQAAVFATLGVDVFTIEIVPELAERARRDLARLGYTNVIVKSGDGYSGWREAAPFDAIVVTAAPPRIPEPLIDQLAPRGRLVIPVGARDDLQELQVYERSADGLRLRHTTPVRFVPMIGEAAR